MLFDGDKRVSLTYEQYKNYNINESSELFFSIMAVFHNKLPCS